MKNIIGMCGKKGVGKNFVADLAVEVLNSSSTPMVQLMACAEPLKEFLATCLGLKREWLYGSDKDKNNPTTIPWSQMPQYTTARYGKPGFMTYREVMQVFGTDVMRDCFDLNIWVNTLLRRIDSCPAHYVFVTDIRFPNEIDAIRSRDAKLWLVDGPQRGDAAVKNDKHSSEQLSEHKVDYDVIIHNELDTTIDELKAQIRKGLGL